MTSRRGSPPAGTFTPSKLLVNGGAGNGGQGNGGAGNSAVSCLPAHVRGDGAQEAVRHQAPNGRCCSANELSRGETVRHSDTGQHVSQGRCTVRGRHDRSTYVVDICGPGQPG